MAPVPYLGLELTIHIIKSQIHLVRQSLYNCLLQAQLKVVPHKIPHSSYMYEVSRSYSICSLPTVAITGEAPFYSLRHML
jgi:hypothetical protein